jgi:hypothetical protein
MSTELTPYSGQEAFRASTDAAQLCKQIVLATAKPIKGKRFVGVEGWQAIALAHGCVASSGEVERIDTGFRAIGKVVRMSDGQTLSTAEGFVGDDEPLWAARPEYARRAMAQTRSISRACRSAFAHVVVMMQAGLETTPAEEMQGEEQGAMVSGEVVTANSERDKELKALCAQAGTTPLSFLVRMKVKSAAELSDADYQGILANVRSKIKAAQERTEIAGQA